MQRSEQREATRQIREEIRQATEQRTCCPLSFCQSRNHKSIVDCDHPDKMVFIGTFHNAISRQCFEVVQSGTFVVTDVIEDLKNRYFTEEHITDEQIDILLVRLRIPPTKTWGKTRTEKIGAIMVRYAKLMEEYYYGHWTEPDDEMMDQIDILVLDNPEQEPNETEDPTRIQLLLKESPHTLGGYLTDPQHPNTLLECPICYEPECFITTNCQHIFCECILKHVATSKPQNDGQTITCCPCCREPLTVLEISHKKHYKIISALSEFYTE